MSIDPQPSRGGGRGRHERPVIPPEEARALTTPLYFEDLAVGQTFGTGTVTVEPEMIRAFAADHVLGAVRQLTQQASMLRDQVTEFFTNHKVAAAERRDRWSALRRDPSRQRTGLPIHNADRRASRRPTAAFFLRPRDRLLGTDRGGRQTERP